MRPQKLSEKKHSRPPFSRNIVRPKYLGKNSKRGKEKWENIKKEEKEKKRKRDN
jgi:hypothetical protein